MIYVNTFDKQRYIFASLFLVANKLQVIGDSHLKQDDITTKQWFLILIISQFKEKPPMITDVANLMGTSRQNVKQLALKLEEKGFLNIEKDKQDSRTLRLKLTEKNQWFWEKREEKDRNFVTNLFKSLSVEELDIMCQGFSKLLNEIE